jgi:hypothetical protein
MRVEEEFRKIVDAGATEYMLVNVSELREFVMEARMLAEITWDAKTAFAKPDAANRFVDWWSREYFGDTVAGDVAKSYRGYYQALPSWEQIAIGGNAVVQALTALEAKLSPAGPPAAAPSPAGPALPELEQRSAAYSALLETVYATAKTLTGDRLQFFFEHVTLPLLIDARQTSAAMKLRIALAASDPTVTRRWCLQAFDDLKMLEDDIRRAERAPFENWYRKSWIRDDNSPYNVHRSYQRTLSFLIAHYLNP